MKVTYMQPNKSQLFWLQDKPEDPQFQPHARIKMVQVMGSPLYIGGGEERGWETTSVMATYLNKSWCPRRIVQVIIK